MTKYKDRPFVLLGVDVGDELDVVKSFVKEKEVNWRHFFDGQKAPIAAAWGIRAYPTMHLIDHEGKIAVANIGKGSLADAIERFVKKAEASSAPKPEKKAEEAGD